MNRTWAASRGRFGATKSRVSSDHVALPVARTLSSIGPMTFQLSDHASRPGRPRKRGCLASPRKGRYASLYRIVKSAPHHSTIGTRDVRQMLTDVRRFCGHSLVAPSDVVDQSRASRRLASSLSPGKTRPRRDEEVVLIAASRVTPDEASGLVRRF